MSAPRIRLARPRLGAAELNAIGAVLESGMLVQGRVVEQFENAAAERVGRRFAVAVSSGTAALSLALRALDIRDGEVLVPDVTWPSPAHAVHMLGARSALVPIDPGEWNSTAEAFGTMRGPDTKAAIVIDQFGVPARHTEIAAQLSSVPIIEDAACAIGSSLDGVPCGRFGLISCFSFHPRKVLTTGEGGLCMTDEPELAARLRRLRNHGQESAGVFVAPSGNERLTEMQAAMGLVQLGRLDDILARRRSIAAHYRSVLSSLGRVQRHPPGANCNEQTFGVVVPARHRDQLIAALDRAGVEAGRLSYALHRLPSLVSTPPIARLDTKSAAYSSSLDVVDGGVALPLHAEMSDEDVERVASSTKNALLENTAA